MSKTIQVKCACGTVFTAKVADRKRGWAQSCSKSCAAIKRERKLDRFGFQRGKPGTFHSRMHDMHNRPDSYYGEEFATAHLFDNCEHDCNKE